MKEIYLDNAATTPVLPEVAELMTKVMLTDYGNPSSLHHKGFEAESYIRTAKKIIAKSLKAEEKEIVFTSGGTESNNMALFCGAESRKRYGRHIISTSIEHASVYNPIIRLQDLGYEITFLPVDGSGRLAPETLRNALRKDTILVSVMMVNNEIGAIEPIEELAKTVHEQNPNALFHVDAIQAYGKLPICPKKMGIDLLSVSGHKLHGPKGSGFLYIRDKIALQPFIFGGGQQRDRRSGTENVPAIAGLGAAVEWYMKDNESKRNHMWELKEQLIRDVQTIPGTVVNGLPKEEKPLHDLVRETAPHIVSISFEGIRSEVLLHTLEERGIYVSSGSACSSNHPAISGTLKAIGVKESLLDSTIRFSFSDMTTEDDISETVSVLREQIPILSKYRRS